MFLISDGNNTLVSTTFPFPYGSLPAVSLFDATRRALTAPLLIALEAAVLCYMLFLVATRPDPTFFTAFSVGYPSLITLLKFALQRKIRIQTDRARIVSIAPKIIWVEHLLLSLTLLCSAVWGLCMPVINGFVSSLFCVVALVGVTSLVWPFWVVKKLEGQAREHR